MNTASRQWTDPHFASVNVTPPLPPGFDEDAAYDAFQERIRVGVLDYLDALMSEIGIPTDEDAATPRRRTLLGARDEDLNHLFPALDQQARLLWQRGGRAHAIAQAQSEGFYPIPRT